MKIIVDTLGGDNAPLAVFQGVLDAMAKDKELQTILVGKKEEITSFFQKNNGDLSRIEIIEAEEAVLNTDHPSLFLKQKPNSSLAKCFEALRTRNDISAMVSAGPTGAILTGTVLRIGRIPGIARPALMATIPTRPGPLCRVMDVGANMDCKPEYLYQFAIMADAYLKTIGVANPRIGLLNVGAEEGKGNELAKAAYPLLQQSGLNFVGNIEGDHVLRGEADAVICDGFSGNVWVKSLEEACKYVSDLFKEAVTGNPLAKFGALFQLKGLKKAKLPFEMSRKACAPLLGAKKVIVKAHGKAEADSIMLTIEEAVRLVKEGLIEKIGEAMKPAETQQ